MTASGSRIAEIRARHYRRVLLSGDYESPAECSECHMSWPCDASILAEMLTPERLADAAQRHGPIGIHPPLTCSLACGPAILAALEATP